MFCKNCGSSINDEAVVCPHCGCATGKVTREADASSAGWAILGFFIPLIGLILYLIWKPEYPLRAKSAGKGALIGVIVSVVVYILYFVALGSLLGGMTMLA